MDIERKPQKHRAIAIDSLLKHRAIVIDSLQKHRAIVIDSLLNSIEYEIKEEGEAEDILELIIDIRNTADRIIKLL